MQITNDVKQETFGGMFVDKPHLLYNLQKVQVAKVASRSRKY